MRSARPPRADTPGLSRFPSGMHAYMHGVFDRAGSGDISRSRCRRCGLPPTRRASAPRRWFPFRGSVARPARTPVNASPAALRPMVHDSEPVWVATPSPYDTCIHNIPAVLPPHPRGKTGPPARVLTMAASVGVCRTPVSRLFTSAGWPIAVRVLLADAARTACGPVLVRTACHAAQRSLRSKRPPATGDHIRPTTSRCRSIRSLAAREAGPARRGPSEHAAAPRKPEIGRRFGVPGAHACALGHGSPVSTSACVIRVASQRPPAHLCAWRLSA